MPIVPEVRWSFTSGVLILFLAVASCSGTGSTAGGDGEHWVIREDLRIGALEGPPELVFGQIRGVYPGANGEMWVLESQIPELRIYSASGDLLRTVGRRGEGPGEFTGNVCLHPGPDGEIWVEDSLRRWQRFDSSGEYIGSNPSTSNVGCGIRRWTNSGRYFAVGSEMTEMPPAPSRTYFVEHRLTQEGALAVVDTFDIPELPQGNTVTWLSNESNYRIIASIPFSPRASFHLGRSGDFWVSPGDGSYRIHRLTLEGDTVLSIEREGTGVAIPDSIREESIESFYREGFTAEGGFDPNDVPRVYPPLERVEEATDGKLWVFRTGEGGVLHFDVFSPEGEYLARADVPENFDRMLISVITEEFMYGSVRGELDIPYVIRLRIGPSSAP